MKTGIEMAIDQTTEGFANIAIGVAASAALTYLNLNGLTADDKVLREALATATKARINEALDDAREAIECGMTQVAEATFVATMRLAGIEAAKTVGT